MKESPYARYPAVSEDGSGRLRGTIAEKARGAKYGFDEDVEGMRTAYDTYKRSGDPDAEKISARIGKADPSAIRKVQQANRESDAEYKRESRRGNKFAKGGSVSRRADGIAARGKTRGKMV